MAETDKRTAQIEERKERLREVTPQLERVRVVPASDELRRALVHPTSRIKFPASGSVEWPLDQFTRRRIEDGSVTVEEGAPQQGGQPQQRSQPRQGAESDRPKQRQDSASPAASSSNPTG